MGQGICGGIQLEFEIEDYEIKRYGEYFSSTEGDCEYPKSIDPIL
jgi:hypothetical protein